MNYIAHDGVKPGDTKVKVAPASTAGLWESERGQHEWITGCDVCISGDKNAN